MSLLGAPPASGMGKALVTATQVSDMICEASQPATTDVRHLWHGAGGTVNLTRVGNLVELAVWGAPIDTSASTQMTLPEGYRPAFTRLFNDAAYTEKQGSTRVNVYPFGRVVLYGLKEPEPVYFTISWQTEEPLPLVNKS